MKTLQWFTSVIRTESRLSWYLLNLTSAYFSKFSSIPPLTPALFCFFEYQSNSCLALKFALPSAWMVSPRSLYGWLLFIFKSYLKCHPLTEASSAHPVWNSTPSTVHQFRVCYLAFFGMAFLTILNYIICLPIDGLSSSYKCKLHEST